MRQSPSVREVEAEVRKLTDLPSATGLTATGNRAPYLVDLENQIAQQLGTKVAIRPGRKKAPAS